MITPAQREARRHFEGSSDAAAICGVDPWKSAFAVFAEKVYDVTDLPNEGPIKRGNRYEGPILDFAEETLGPLERNVSLHHPDGIRAANLDARVVGKREGVEAKFTGQGHDFGEPGTDEIPERVIVQCSHQMYVADLEVVHVPVLLARFGRLEEVMFRVDRHEDLISSIIAKEDEFWERYVLPKVPPPLDGPPALEVIKRIRRQPASIVGLDPSLIESWEEAKAYKKEAEEAEERAKTAVLAALGDAEAGDYGDPAKILTYYEQTRSDVDRKRLQAFLPEVWEEFKTSTAYRVARLSKRT